MSTEVVRPRGRADNTGVSPQMHWWHVPALVLIDAAVALAGAWILWVFADGPTVASPSIAGIGLFVSATSVLFLFRGLVLQRIGVWPQLVYSLFLSVALLVACIFVFASLAYFPQWVATYCAMVWVCLHIAGMIMALLRFGLGSWAEPVLRAVCLAAGIGALVLTVRVHNWNLDLLVPIALLIAVSMLLGRLVLFWAQALLAAEKQDS